MADRVRNEGYEVDVDRGEEGMFRVFVDRGARSMDRSAHVYPGTWPRTSSDQQAGSRCMVTLSISACLDRMAPSRRVTISWARLTLRWGSNWQHRNTR